MISKHFHRPRSSSTLWSSQWFSFKRSWNYQTIAVSIFDPEQHNSAVTCNEHEKKSLVLQLQIYQSYKHLNSKLIVFFVPSLIWREHVKTLHRWRQHCQLPFTRMLGQAFFIRQCLNIWFFSTALVDLYFSVSSSLNRNIFSLPSNLRRLKLMWSTVPGIVV